MNSDESERNREVNEISQRPTEPVPHLPIGNQAYKAFFDAFKAWESHKGRSSTDTSPMYSIEVTADHLPNNPDLRGTAVFGADQAYKVWIIVKVWNIPDNKTRYVTIAERTQIENGQHGQYVVSTAATAGDGPNCNKLGSTHRLDVLANWNC